MIVAFFCAPDWRTLETVMSQQRLHSARPLWGNDDDPQGLHPAFWLERHSWVAQNAAENDAGFDPPTCTGHAAGWPVVVVACLRYYCSSPFHMIKR